ncbi:MAG: phosphoribosylformylglycinamidine synthase, partial [Methylophilaceae bacterium]
MQPAHFLSLRGSAAVSAFRLSKIIHALKNSAPNINHIYAEFIHFAFSDTALTRQQQNTLQQILTYGPKAGHENPNGELFLVVPRIGTISPWASRATDIAQHCGLSGIKRLERGVAFYVTSAPSNTLTETEKNALKPLIHDRMT